jgi:hypothetical protein
MPSMLGALAVWFAFSGVEVVGDAACPDPSEVSRRLAQIAAPAGHGDAAERRARLWRDERTVHVQLMNAAGQRLGERDLDASASCEDLAQAVAIVIAAWQAELDPRVTSHVDLPRPAPATPIVTTAAFTPAPRGSPPSFDLGLALLASVAGGQVAPGARVQGWVAPGGGHLGLGVAVSGATARSEPVGQLAGAARWTRIALGAGPEARFEAGRTMLGAHAQLLAGVLHVQGVGLETDASDTAVQVGAGAGVQIGRPWGNATPWIGADVLYWPGHDRLEIAGLTAQGELPRLEVQVALGLSLGRFP